MIRMIFFHTNVRWLSRKSETKRVFKFIDEFELFFTEHGKTEFFNCLNNKKQALCLAYLVNIFEQLYKRNIQIKGRSINIIKQVDWAKHKTVKKNIKEAKFERYFSKLNGIKLYY